MKNTIFLILCGLAVSGCSSSPPDCDNDEVQNTVIRLVDEKTQIGYSMGVQLGAHLQSNGIDVDTSKIGFRLEEIRNKSIDKNIKRTSCIANLKITYADKAYFQRPINYTAQLTDKKEIYVEIN